jgi:hypothetical protein
LAKEKELWPNSLISKQNQREYSELIYNDSEFTSAERGR